MYYFIIKILTKNENNILKRKLPISTCRMGWSGEEGRQCEFLGSLGASGKIQEQNQSNDG